MTLMSPTSERVLTQFMGAGYAHTVEREFIVWKSTLVTNRIVRRKNGKEK